MGQLVKGRRQLVLAASLVVVAGITSALMLKWRREVKIGQFYRDASRARIAVLSYYIDDCGGVADFPENNLPPCLTTPVAYIDRLPADPFGEDGKAPRFVQTPRSGNGAQFIIASRGPDRDWDIDRISSREERIAPWHPSGKVTDFRRPGDEHWRPGSPYVVGGGYSIEAVALRYEGGREEVVPKFTALTFGKLEAKFNPRTPESVLAELATDGVSIYDPTNGATSDGDLILLYIGAGNDAPIWASGVPIPEPSPTPGESVKYPPAEK